MGLDLLREGAEEVLRERGGAGGPGAGSGGGGAQGEEVVVEAGARGGGAGEGRGGDAGELLHHGAEVGGVGGEHRGGRAARRPTRPLPRPPRRRRRRCVSLVDRRRGRHSCTMPGQRRRRVRARGLCAGRDREWQWRRRRRAPVGLGQRRRAELLEAVDQGAAAEAWHGWQRRLPEQGGERRGVGTASGVELVVAAAGRLQAAAVAGVHSEPGAWCKCNRSPQHTKLRPAPAWCHYRSDEARARQRREKRVEAGTLQHAYGCVAVAGVVFVWKWQCRPWRAHD